MSYITNNVAKYVKDMGINLSKMAKKTGVEYSALYDSLAHKGRDRDLRDEEFVEVCKFLGVNPMDFADEPGETARE